MAIHIIHTKRTLNKPNTFYVGRPTVLGNPYTHYHKSTLADIQVATIEEAVASYEDYFYDKIDNPKDEDKAFRDALEDIFIAAEEQPDIYLACWCKDEVNPFQTDYKLCHADVIRNFITDELAEIR